MSAPKPEAVRKRVAQLLALGRSRKEIRELTGVAGRSVSKWLREDPFKQLVREMGNQAVRRVYGRLLGPAGRAVDNLDKMQQDASQKAETRVNASGRILQTMFKSYDLMELSGRLEALEEAERRREEREKGQQ